jgi:DinB superfamily
MNRLQLAIEQIVFARKYTIGLLDGTPETDWFRQTPGGVSHVGWQVGHIAFAEYRMALLRIRGPRPQDDGLLSPEFLRLFGANSVPDADPSKYPAPADIRAVLDRVHEQALRELPSLSDAELDQPVSHPHRFAKTKLLGLLWCAHHEMLHAGQIGLLRRLLGHAPLW